ncbi:hypothetical protein [Sphingobium yanoikuyae]|uniref:Uncharacterized protein n=1 Tax=Sphingobium yanoikuyae TaxID=13690 RepID=A0A9X7YDD3_SPHYA|nr:hypothetical protein [Sphingobium yanoikuyae]QNG46178.1 hypothetical protein H3V42_00370 [Sphingobium yanoikuyae]
MPPTTGAAIPAAPRKTLLEWIEHDDGDQTSSPIPKCSRQAAALHPQILVAQEGRGEPLAPPRGFHLAPLG